MARMVPPVAHLGTKSEGEARVFERLRDDSATALWTVLHSFDLPTHATRFMGEIDFVVIVPEHGVLCLSVKDCASVVRDADGIWHLGTLPPSAAGPFKAARDDMFSLRTKIIQERPELHLVPFAFAVLFTRVVPRGDLKRRPDEWDTHEQIFADDLRHQPMPDLLLAAIDETVQKINTTTRARVHPESFTEEQAVCLVEALRPELEMYQLARDRARQTAAELKRYTDEQFDALDAAECNDRVLYHGLAGTGKTILALESTRRSVARGKKTLLLCFNSLLQEWLQDQIGDLDCDVQTVHGLLYRLSNASYQASPPPSFWENLASQALERLLDSPTQDNIYDTLIVDEAQDVLRPEFMDVLDLILNGGLTGGRWLMFADAEQNIFGRDRSVGSEDCDPVDYCFQRGGSAFRYPLRRNCRNTPRVGQFAELLGQLSPGYSGYRRPDDGISPNLRFYSSTDEQQSLLASTLTTLKDERFSADEIVVLSPKATERCCATELCAGLWKGRIRPFQSGLRAIRFCSIYRFKGMEAPCIVVTDIEELGAQERASLLYVALTRAVNRVVILAHTAVQTEIKSLLMKEK